MYKPRDTSSTQNRSQIVVVYGELPSENSSFVGQLFTTVFSSSLFIF